MHSRIRKTALIKNKQITMSYPIVPEPEQKYPEDIKQEVALRAIQATTGSTEQIIISTNRAGDAVFTKKI